MFQAHESRRYLTAEERLYHDLLNGYEDHFVNTRPVSKHNETMKVSVGMSFININSFDESTGVGEFLTWDRNVRFHFMYLGVHVKCHFDPKPYKMVDFAILNGRPCHIHSLGLNKGYKWLSHLKWRSPAPSQVNFFLARTVC